MGALGTGLSQSYMAGQQADALKGLFGGANPPVPGAGGGGGLKDLLGFGKKKSTAVDMGDLSKFSPPGMSSAQTMAPTSAPGDSFGQAPGVDLKAAMGYGQPAGGGIMDSLKGVFGGGGAPSIQSTLTPNMPGGGPAKGASGMFNLMKLFVR